METQQYLSHEPSAWTEEQLNLWFESGSFLNGLSTQPDASINRRAFAEHYFKHKETWADAFAFLKDTDLTAIPLGRVDLKNGMYASVSEYFPKEHSETLFETHRKYIDIQYVISGKELIGLTPIENTTVVKPYDETKDMEFETAIEYSLLKANPSSFFIFFPEDAHRPNMKDGNDKVRKVVIKIVY